MAFVRVRMRALMLQGLLGSAVNKDIDLGRGKAAALDAMSRKLGVEAEAACDAIKLLQGDACVNGCAEKHVATDAGETIEVGNPHYESGGRWPEV